MKICLASSSKRRIDFLKEYGYEFIIKPSIHDEILDNSLDIYNRIIDVAYKKIEDNIKNDDLKEYIHIACDTVVYFNNKVYGKPKDYNDAKKMLMDFSSNKHSVISGVVIIYKNKIYKFYEETFVYFKKLNDKIIDEYLNNHEYLDKAGSYGIQDLNDTILDKYIGSLNNVIGFPIEKISKIIREIENEVEN